MNKLDGTFDYSKFFMGLAVAIVFVLQSWHSIQISDIRATVVPRTEYEEKHKIVMPREEIMSELKLLEDRLDSIDKDK